MEPPTSIRETDFGKRMLAIRKRVERCPYIPHIPHPKQALYLAMAHERELLFGGAAGGGKSDVALMGALIDKADRASQSLIVRRTLTELKLPGALLYRAREWLANTDAEGREGGKVWTFPKGGVLVFGYLEDPGSEYQYQGSEWGDITFEELTQWANDEKYLYVCFSRTRRAEGSDVETKARATSNPGGPGHTWVKKRWNLPHGTPTRPFIQSKIDDNPSLDYEDYVKSLSELHPVLRAQLLEGRWDAKDPGDYWRSEWVEFAPEALPHSMKRTIRFWDLAASEKSDACYTAGTKQSKGADGYFYIEHMKRFRRTAQARNRRILETAIMDGRRCVVGIEQEPGSGGLAQVQDLSKLLRAKGFKVWVFTPNKTTGDKMKRMDPVAANAEAGRYRIVCDLENPEPWVEDFTDQMEAFPSGVKDSQNVPVADVADSVSGGYAYLRNKTVPILDTPEGRDSGRKVRTATASQLKRLPVARGRRYMG